MTAIITSDRYSYGEPLPYRFSNDAYIENLLYPLHRNVVGNINAISFYNEPAKKFTGKYADDRHDNTQYSCDYMRHTLLTDELNTECLIYFQLPCDVRVASVS